MKILKMIIKKVSVKWIALSVLGVALFLLAHKLATVERSYNAMGGEMFMLLIPFFVWYVQDCKKQLKEDKNGKVQNHKQR